jgi:transcription initiation factor TFIID subunit TAF12
VVVVCYWKWKWNKYNTKTIEDIEMHLKVNIYIYIAWFEDTKGIIRIRKSKDRQHNGQQDKRINNDLQNITYKTNDRVTRTPLKTGGELRCSGKIVAPAVLF